jgi:hypothetical protein
MPAHEHIEDLLTRKPGERYRAELEEAYRRERRDESFEDFQKKGGGAEWEAWRDEQLGTLRAEDALHVGEMGPDFRLKLKADLNSPPADFPPAGYPLFGELLAGFGDGTISDEFKKKAGIPSDAVLADRWGQLVGYARLDVQRRSTDLTSVLKDVQEAARAELFREPDALPWPQIRAEDDAATRQAKRAEHNRLARECDNLMTEMEDFSKSLIKWETAIKEKADPSTYELSSASISSFGYPKHIIARVTSLFPILNGKKAPVATYKVVATVQAICEMWARQARARLPPHTLTRLFDRLTEVPGRAEPKKQILALFRDDYKHPGRVWDGLMTLARERPRKPPDPALEARFKRFMSEDQASGTTGPQGARIRSIKSALEKWGTKKLKSPADEKSFEALTSVAFEVAALKEEISEMFSGRSDSEQAIREELDGIIDAALARLRNELVAYTS